MDLSDTIHDLIVDTVGAAVVSIAGWRYLARARTSYVDNWARRFIQRNPQVFGDQPNGRFPLPGDSQNSR